MRLTEPVPHGASPDLVREEPHTDSHRAAGWTGTASHAPNVDPARRLTAASESRLATIDVGAAAEGVFNTARTLIGRLVDRATLDRTLGAARGVVDAFRTGLGLAGSVDLDHYGKDERLAQSIGPVADFLYDRYWRVTVEGAEHVPRRSAILVANHSGALPFDGYVIHLALRRERPDLAEPRWLVEDQIFYAPFVGTLVNRLGAIRANPENATRLLEEGRPVVVFPEGVHGMSKPYRERYQLKRFGRGGFVKLALRTGAPIVPVAVVGAEESMPLLARLPGGVFGLPYLPLTLPPLPARWMIRFGQRIDLGGATATHADDPACVQRLNDTTREAIQGMLTAMLEGRTTVFR